LISDFRPNAYFCVDHRANQLLDSLARAVVQTLMLTGQLFE